MQYDADFLKNIYSHNKDNEKSQGVNGDVTCFL